MIDSDALDEFLAAAMDTYRLVLISREPVPCFAVLLGNLDGVGRVAHVRRVAFTRNARASDPAALSEFAEVIVPRFGVAYEDQVRGWWVDSRDLLRSAREAESEGLDILGGIHLHPDWHRIGPSCERGVVLSERPTPMDEYVFGAAGWPANCICYIERRGQEIHHALAAWASRPDDGVQVRCTEVPLGLYENARSRKARQLMTDDEQIHALWATLAWTWAAGNPDRFAAVFSEDCDFTTVRGDKPPGRQGIAAVHRQLFRTVYKDTTLDAQVTDICYRRTDLATVNAVTTIRSTDGTPLTTTHALAVAENASSQWQITAFHNMVPIAASGAELIAAVQPAKSKEPFMTARPTVRHIAITARDPQRLAEFYSSIFGMEVFYRDPNGPTCCLSDGYLTLSLVKYQLDGDAPPGYNHFGFAICEGTTEHILENLVTAGVDKPAPRHGKRPHAEYRAIDPEGNWFDITEHGYGP